MLSVIPVSPIPADKKILLFALPERAEIWQSKSILTSFFILANALFPNPLTPAEIESVTSSTELPQNSNAFWPIVKGFSFGDVILIVLADKQL